MKIYLLCTNHSNQMIGYANGNSEKFLHYLKHVYHDINDIDLIAEELNEEALNLWKATDSACRIFAQSMKLMHHYCDPNSHERHLLGIETDLEIRTRLGYGKLLTIDQDNQVQLELIKYFSVREKFWLANLLSFDCKKCLFVFGKTHFDSFSKLLSSSGILFEELDRNWK